MTLSTVLFPYNVMEDDQGFLHTIVTGGRQTVQLDGNVTLMRGATDENPIDCEVVEVTRTNVRSLREQDHTPSIADMTNTADLDQALYVLAGYAKSVFGPDSNFTILKLRQKSSPVYLSPEFIETHTGVAAEDKVFVIGVDVAKADSDVTVKVK